MICDVRVVLNLEGKAIDLAVFAHGDRTFNQKFCGQSDAGVAVRSVGQKNG